MNCKDCKFWTRKKIYKVIFECKACDNKWYEHTRYIYENELRNYKQPTYYKVHSIKEMPCNFGDCVNDNIKYHGIEAEDMVNRKEADCFIYCDNEQYGASHITGETFGCKYFEEKT